MAVVCSMVSRPSFGNRFRPRSSLAIPKGDRTGVLAAIFADKQDADENRGEPAHCEVLRR